MAETIIKKKPIEEESFIDFLFKYIDIILQYKIIVIAAIFITTPVIYIFLKAKQPEFKPKYKSEAKIRIMAEGLTEKGQGLKWTIQEEYQQVKRRVDDLAGIMRSTTVLEKGLEKVFPSQSKDWILSYAKVLYDSKQGLFTMEKELNYIYLTLIGNDPQQVTDILNGIIEATREELLNIKKLVTKEALESLEKQLKEIRYDLEQAKLQLTKFIIGNEVLSEAIEIKEGKGQLTEDVDKLALQLIDIRSQHSKIQDFIKEVQNIRNAAGDIETFKTMLYKDEKLVDANLLKNLSENEAALNDLLLVNKEAHPDVLKAKDRLEQTKILIGKGIDEAVSSLKRENETLKTREEKLTNLIEKGLSEAMIEYSQLQRNVTLKEKLAQKVIDSLQELSLASKLIDTGTFTIVDPPLEPKAPFNLYEKTRAVSNNILFSAILGISVGIGLAVLIDYLTMTVKDIREIEEALEIPILGEIPTYEKSYKEQKPTLPLRDDPKSIISEAFRGLRTNIKFRCAGKAIKTILVTSLVPEEGKSFICANLAAAFAQTDEKILVIDCDLRKSTLHRYYGIDNKKGISQLSKGEKDIVPVSNAVANLDVLVTGKHPSNPTELLSSDGFDKVLTALKQQYDIIIVDSPPLFAVADASILIKKMDATLLTIRANVTPKKALRRATKLDEDVQSKILGMVFNAIDTRRGRYGSYYYYKYDYYGKKEEKKA